MTFFGLVAVNVRAYPQSRQSNTGTIRRGALALAGIDDFSILLLNLSDLPSVPRCDDISRDVLTPVVSDVDFAILPYLVCYVPTMSTANDTNMRDNIEL